jgi:hypothetical protein
MVAHLLKSATAAPAQGITEFRQFSGINAPHRPQLPCVLFVWRNLMTTKICPCCGEVFQPRPQVQNQTYCSAPACQRERRQAWQRKKLQDDRFYRENQQDAQRAWRQRNPEYSRNYRATNNQYANRNRAQQRATPNGTQELDNAKMDER